MEVQDKDEIVEKIEADYTWTSRKFGKHLQKRQLDIPEYASSFVNYKGLKKLIKQLAAGTRTSSNSRDGTFARTNSDSLSEFQAALQANKATFFFRLDREIEKVNAFYLYKQEELRLRLQTLLDKKRLMQSRSETASKTSTTFVTLLEGFQQFGNDLNKLQQFVELNATGFSKILKKWDKTSKSRTKELYLSRAVEIQPCFNRDVISDLSDQATTSLLELEAWAEGENISFSRDPGVYSSQNQAAVHDANADFLNTVIVGNAPVLSDAITALRSNPQAPERLTRAFLAAIPEASDECLGILVSSGLVNLNAQDEINERNCLHEAAIAGRQATLEAGLSQGVDFSRKDVYGRLPLHYACIHGHVDNVEALLNAGPATIDVMDHDNLTPLLLSINHAQTQCVERLISHKARIDQRSDQDYIPLNLACQHGFEDIAEMLLMQKAQIVPDAEGLFPQHLVARHGHSVQLLMMLRNYGADMNEVDKLNQWTPTFHAASEGHVELVKALLENDARQDILDENGLSAMYYSAWEGHLDCMHLLFAARSRKSLQTKLPVAPARQSPRSADSFTPMSLDGDNIPDLSLPPPILPLRRYGHNFLDTKTFVQLSFDETGFEAIYFYQKGKYPAARLTISSKSSDLIPRNIQLPLTDDAKIISFQIDTLDSFAIDFDIFPTFGTKVIAKTVALSKIFNNGVTYGHSVLPLFDSRTRAIGQLSFDFQIIKPFQGVPLEIAHFATYWKATSQFDSRPLITGSSLQGEYIRIFIQVTKDLVPVVFPQWSVTYAGMQLPICNLTYAEFQNIGLQYAQSTPQQVKEKLSEAIPLEQLYILLHSSFLSLAEILSSLAPHIHLNLYVLYPPQSERREQNLLAWPDLNVYVDTVLATVFEHARHIRELSPDLIRSVMFTASNTSVCTALNWKQPNYPVFFCSGLGKDDFQSADDAPGDIVQHSGNNSISLKEAVRFAQSNNLMGLICSARLLDIVPALIESVKVGGLVLVSETSGILIGPPPMKLNAALDGVLHREGILRFSETIDM